MEETVDQAEIAVDQSDAEVPEEGQTEQHPENLAESDEAEVIDDSEEIDYEGEKYRVPKALRDAFMRTKDYTEKTTNLSAERRAFEQQQAHEKEHIQRLKQHIQDYAQIHALDMQLKQFEGFDWDSYQNEDPLKAMSAWRDFQTLKEMRGGIATRIQQVEAQEAFEKQRETARRIEEGREVLKRDIPNWSDQTQKAIADYAISTGFKPEEVAQVVDPRHVKVLHKAMLYDQMMKKAASQPKAEVKPVQKVSSSRDGQAKDPDRMSTDEWLKWRNQQLRKQA